MRRMPVALAVVVISGSILTAQVPTVADALAEIEQRIAFGYDAYTSEVYFQAKEAALRAGIDLSESMEDRMNLYNDILKLYVPREKQLELEVKAGQRSQSDLNKIKVERLNVEIEMLKEQLNESD